jgi:membrane protease YdiL (CAAX protease family)
MIAEARQQIRWKHHFPRPIELIIEILIFAVVLFVSYLVLTSVLAGIGLIPLILFNGDFAEVVKTAGTSGMGAFDSTTIERITAQVMQHPATTIVSLFATLGAIIGAIIYCRAIERRKLAAMGFRRGHVLREYLKGLLIGFVMFGIAVLICLATGTLTFEGLAFGSAGFIVLFFCGFLIQGMSEEVLCRGYFMVSLARRQSLPVAIIVSSCAFGALHLANSGIQPLAVINVVLFGSFAGIYLLKRGNIWGVAAIHSMWNFTQGNIFGIQVSGTAKMESVLLLNPTPTGELINGGAFGLEGGLAVTIVLAAGLIIALLMKSADPAPPASLSQGSTPPMSPSQEQHLTLA